jgi:hypothetical protein
MKPLVIDLCCGLGGWTTAFLAAGFTAIGFDVEPLLYPGHLVVQDVRTLDGYRFRSAAVIVASPPCEEFTRHDLPWTRTRSPPPPDLSVVRACYRLAAEAGVPLVLENVRGAVPWLGPPVARHGRQYLWGDGVPALIPLAVRYRKNESGAKSRLSSARRRERALIPPALAAHIAACYARSR